MKTKREKVLEGQVKDLQNQLEDSFTEKDAITIVAGDTLVALFDVVQLVERQNQMLAMDEILFNAFSAAIERKQGLINNLEGAESRRQREQELAEKSATSLKSALDTNELTNWALKVSTAVAEGLVFTTTPDRYGRVMKSTTEIDEYGKMGKTKAITKGNASVTFKLPVFGDMTVKAKISHTEIRDTPEAKEVNVTNEVSFKIKINGVVRHVLIASGGRVREGFEWSYKHFEAQSRFAQVLVDGDPYYCDVCLEYHSGGGDVFNAKVTTEPMPEPYRRRTGGCGCW